MAAVMADFHVARALRWLRLRPSASVSAASPCAERGSPNPRSLAAGGDHRIGEACQRRRFQRQQIAASFDRLLQRRAISPALRPSR